MSARPFQAILSYFRKYARSERERLMQAYLQTDPRYAALFTNVWLWNNFPARQDFRGKDTGIDLVARTTSGDYWAIQCKCFQENATIDKPAVDSFIPPTNISKVTSNAWQSIFTSFIWNGRYSMLIIEQGFSK